VVVLDFAGVGLAGTPGAGAIRDRATPGWNPRLQRY